MFIKIKTVTLIVINILYKSNILSEEDNASLKLIASRIKDAKSENALNNTIKALLLLEKNIGSRKVEKDDIKNENPKDVHDSKIKSIYNFIKKISNATKSNVFLDKIDKVYNKKNIKYDEVLSIFEEYTEYLEGYFIEMNKQELKYNEISEVLDTVFDTMAKLPKSNNEFSNKLFELKKEIDKTDNIKSVKKLKENIVKVIASIQDEIVDFNDEMNTILKENLEFANSKIKALELKVDKVVNDSYIDPLTGALNRKWLEDYFDDFFWFEKSNSNLFAILDIDYFKQVNDTYGHAAGDFALKEVVERFREVLRGNAEDKIIRYGGDEFILILTEVRESSVDSILERLIISVNSKEFKFEGVSMSLSISVGVSMFREGKNTKEIFELTDKKLYEAKKNGRNCFIKEI